MPRYLEIAAKAKELVQNILATTPEENRPELAAKLAKLYNLGIKTAPRPVQSTVRINAVTAAMRGSPVRVSSQNVPVNKDQPNGKTFVALVVTPVAEKKTFKPEVEGDANDDE